VAEVDDAETRRRVEAERAVVFAIGGGCPRAGCGAPRRLEADGAGGRRGRQLGRAPQAATTRRSSRPSSPRFAGRDEIAHAVTHTRALSRYVILPWGWGLGMGPGSCGCAVIVTRGRTGRAARRRIERWGTRSSAAADRARADRPDEVDARGYDWVRRHQRVRRARSCCAARGDCLRGGGDRPGTAAALAKAGVEPRSSARLDAGGAAPSSRARWPRPLRGRRARTRHAAEALDAEFVRSTAPRGSARPASRRRPRRARLGSAGRSARGARARPAGRLDRPETTRAAQLPRHPRVAEATRTTSTASSRVASAALPRDSS
jgi:hypothetical protein